MLVVSWPLVVLMSFLRYYGGVYALKRVGKQVLSMSTSVPAARYPLKLPKFSNLKGDSIVDEKSRLSRMINFLDSSPEPFHCVSHVVKELIGAGFKQIDEAMLWQKKGYLKKGGKYFFTRNGSSIVAFIVGEKYLPGNGFKVIGAHTDSPNLKIKPNSKRSASNKIIQVNVECYGGGIWHTWFDRDLSLAGRVVVRQADGRFEFRLVKVNQPILRVPNLCIHLRTQDERDSFKVNKEDHLAPILCDEVEKALGGSSSEQETMDQVKGEDKFSKGHEWKEAQQIELLQLLASELQCGVDDISDFELSLYDVQGAAVTGLHQEYICSSRIDNLASCFVAVDALLAYSKSPELICDDEDVSMIALFDHEEVGSESNAGAGSTIMRDAVERIISALAYNEVESTDSSHSSELFKMGLARSLILSVDMAHAIHPNYVSKHDKSHAPTMNSGVVIKSNSNQRYATNGATGFLVRELGRLSGVPVQEFAVRNDCPCGSTIGPIISATTGIRAVDLGMPQLSMHSIREMMGRSDVSYGYNLMYTFFQKFRGVDNSLQRVDEPAQ